MLLGLLLSLPQRAQAGEISPAAIGLRYGSVINNSGERIDAERADFFVLFALPWQGRWDSDWVWRSALELTFGQYTGDTQAWAAAVGPSLIARKQGSRLSLEAGTQLTHLSQAALGARDLGRRTHFTSHLAVLWRLRKHWFVGYGLQHISNAGTREINPGVNSQMLELRYRF